MSRASALLFALSASLVEVTLAFNIAVARAPSCAVTHRRVATPKLEVADAVDVDKAAAAVKKAAAKFGKVQADKTNEWLSAVVASDDGCPTDGLLSEQLILFEECLLDDEGGKCKELDTALTAFGDALAQAPQAGETRAKANLRKFANDRAAARVKAAAAKFGPTQRAFAEDWTKRAITAGGPSSSSLMEETLLLFDKCAVTEDGKADPKCVALFDALDNLQVALTGSVATPSAAAVGKAAAAPAASNAAADGGMRGQFKMNTGRRNNGCWPNNQ